MMFIKEGIIMKHIKNLITVSSLLSIPVMYAAHTNQKEVTPKFTIRSQGFNSVRRLPGLVDNHIYLFGQEDRNNFYATWSLTPEFTRSFRNSKITECLFGDAVCDGSLSIQGSRVANRDSNALLADYFYLPTDFNSIVCFSPRIENITAELYSYKGFDYLLNGLYAWNTITFNWTKWALNIRENVQDYGTNGYDAGYFTPNALSRDVLLEDFRDYALGNTPGTFTQTIGTDDPQQEITAQLRPLQFAKMRKSKSKTNIADIRLGIGYNFLLTENGYLGLGIETAFPTGTRAKAEYLFEPQNGNDKHWELGVNIDGHYTFWRSACENHSCSINLHADILHMFAKRQRRTFDLCDKPLSRYMLAEKMGSEILFNLEGNGTAPDAQFKNIFTPVANITTFDVDVKVGVQADVLVWFNYTVCNWAIDFGYNFWGRSCEKIDVRCDCGQFTENTWALKGDAQVYGFDVDAVDVFGAVPLSATNSEATIYGGTNFGVGGLTTASDILTAKTNPNIDNPQLATGDVTDPFTADTELRVLPIADINDATNPQINTSIQPIFIKQSDINFVRTKGLTHKLFISFNYTWPDRERWIPYLGFGSEVEFAQNGGASCKSSCNQFACDNDCTESCDADCQTNCNTTCDTGNGACLTCGLSQWGIWVKGGVSFE